MSILFYWHKCQVYAHKNIIIICQSLEIESSKPGDFDDCLLQACAIAVIARPPSGVLEAIPVENDSLSGLEIQIFEQENSVIETIQTRSTKQRAMCRYNQIEHNVKVYGVYLEKIFIQFPGHFWH